ncbi:DUF4194 domain-containing protein [Vreelandella utahensis]|uniref:DUF4194 domain-containing protein n=1 Tax=Vreelandella halophila TaxID=86177 RepID=UPI00098554CB|nr:DUF4194 domain-containing protein [Halomonas utahensis]
MEEPTNATESGEANALSPIVVKLLKGVIFEQDDPRLWQQLLHLQPRIRDYVAVMGLALRVDESEGYAWLTSEAGEDSDADIPQLMPRRPLSYPVSLLIALLRRKLAEADTEGGDPRLILDREDIVNMMRTFLPETSNEAKLVDRIDSHLNNVEKLGFIRRLKGQKDKIEVRRIIKAYVDAQWLNEFDQKLQAYREHVAADDSDASHTDNGTD